MDTQHLNWQPIATAPKDGTTILVIDDTCEEPTADTAHWGEDADWYGFRAGPASEWERLGYKTARELIGWYESPTRWAPVPKGWV